MDEGGERGESGRGEGRRGKRKGELINCNLSSVELGKSLVIFISWSEEAIARIQKLVNQ